MSSVTDFLKYRDLMLVLISLDPKMPYNSIRVAILMFYVYADFKDGVCFPSQNTLATQLGVNVKTIRRAVQSLVDAENLMVDGVAYRGKSLRYRPTRDLMDRAKKIKSLGSISAFLSQRFAEILEEEKGRQNGSKAGQFCPERETDQDPKAGQGCPPNSYQEQLPEQGESLPPDLKVKSLVSYQFVPLGADACDEWVRYLMNRHGLDLKGELGPVKERGQLGYRVPMKWPGAMSEEQRELALEYLRLWNPSRKEIG